METCHRARTRHERSSSSCSGRWRRTTRRTEQQEEKGGERTNSERGTEGERRGGKQEGVKIYGEECGERGREREKEEPIKTTQTGSVEVDKEFIVDQVC